MQKQRGCECDCHQPGPRQVDCYYAQKLPDHPQRMSLEVEERIQGDTDRRRRMDCTDCCKAADFDSSFFIIDPRGAVQTTLDPTTPGTSIIMTKMTHRLVDEQDQRPNLRAPNRQGGRLKPYDGRPSEVYEQWIEGWTIQDIPNNLGRNKTPRINFPKRLYVTQSQAIKDG